MASKKLIGGDRPIRGCDVCGGVDDSPRHVLAGEPGAAGEPSDAVVDATLDNLKNFDGETRRRVLRDIMDTSSQDRHMDCCRSVGCPTGTCDQVPDLRDGELLAAIMDGAE